MPGTPAAPTVVRMTVRPVAGYDGDALRAYLAQHRAVLDAGDLEGISDRFDLPALLVEQDRTTLLESPEQVRELDHGRPAATDARDAVAAVPEVVSLEEVGWALLWVDVRWSYVDELAAELTSERCRYLLRRGRDTFEICALVPLPR
ncbi:hypothetical protein GCM10007368_13450 [Isoptericola cucumis]|uniref:SnoaL-like domain-containing protein n=2 Tax=Isoptericola cucumis TaxID=1776856 RepID=A0ABQ2B736_9MICO|nr:hypothetical protein GCM10007368_13450 [Isoptericola cucumis]